MSIQLIKGLRGVSVTVFHPPDNEGKNLVQHLKRIGCQVNAIWPPPKRFDNRSAIVLVAMEQERRAEVMALVGRLAKDGQATLLAVVDYENPATLQMVIESGAYAVIEKPVRPFGLLTNLVIAQSLRQQREAVERKVEKLERKIAGQRKIAQAKSILMKIQGLTEDEAFANIRSQAMAKRTSMEEIALSIINANDLLTYSRKSD
ncbi:MAG: ANTAR domain-containing protein [Rhodobacterales bacterium]|nr:ANTAR domain-containing protein [Rhodobacterales bacterium]